MAGEPGNPDQVQFDDCVKATFIIDDGGGREHSLFQQIMDQATTATQVLKGDVPFRSFTVEAPEGKLITAKLERIPDGEHVRCQITLSVEDAPAQDE